MKTKARQMTQYLNFPRQKTDIPLKTFLTTNFFLLDVNLFTRPFSFNLHQIHLTHYCNSYVDHYTDGMISFHR